MKKRRKKLTEATAGRGWPAAGSWTGWFVLLVSPDVTVDHVLNVFFDFTRVFARATNRVSVSRYSQSFGAGAIATASLKEGCSAGRGATIGTRTTGSRIDATTGTT